MMCVSAFPRSSSFAAGFGKKTNAKKRREKNRQKPTSRAPRLSHPVLVTVFFSRKMVNILNVDRHRQSVAWIKLCIIENVVRVFRAFGSGARRASGNAASGGDRASRRSLAFGRIRLCIRRWATPDNRRFRPSLSARKVQPSESRSAGIKRPRICTHSCLGGNDEKKKLERRTADADAAPHAPRSRQMVCSIGVMAAREVCPITTPAPRGTSVAKRKRSPHRLRASRGAGRARRARERGRVRGKKRRLRSELYLTNNGRAASGASLETRGESCRTISE
jgi:hypothetical protein